MIKSVSYIFYMFALALFLNLRCFVMLALKWSLGSSELQVDMCHKLYACMFSLFLLVFVFIKVSCGRSPMFLTQRISSSDLEGIEEIHLETFCVVMRKEYNGSTVSYQLKLIVVRLGQSRYAWDCICLNLEQLTFRSSSIALHIISGNSSCFFMFVGLWHDETQINFFFWGDIILVLSCCTSICQTTTEGDSSRMARQCILLWGQMNGV